MIATGLYGITVLLLVATVYIIVKLSRSPEGDWVVGAITAAPAALAGVLTAALARSVSARRHPVRFKISPSTDGQYYFEIQAGGNHATLATSETYKSPSKRDVLAAIELIRQGAVDAEVVDNS